MSEYPTYLKRRHEHEARAVHKQMKAEAAATRSKVAVRRVQRDIDDAIEVGLWLLGPGYLPSHRRYRFMDCGHLQDIKPTDVARRRFECQTCPPDITEPSRDLRAEAVIAGLELVGYGKNDLWYLYRLPCGHAQQLHIDHVRRGGAFACATCHAQEIMEDALAAGVSVAGPAAVKGAGYRRYLLPCGHEQEISIAKVRRRNFHCAACGEYSWNQPAYVYAVQIAVGDFAWIKVGFAKSVEDRIKDYGLPDGARVNVLMTKLYPTAFAAQRAEAEMHRGMARLRLPADQMRIYHTKSGATECFACGGTVPQPPDPDQTSQQTNQKT